MINIHEMITNKILAKMEEGRIPWRKPWKFQPPRNYVTKRPYHGVNFLLLTMSNFSSPYWLTFKQTKELGGHVKKGAKGTQVIFWKIVNFVDSDGTKADEVSYRDIPFMQYYTVFNLEQTEGVLNLDVAEEPVKPLDVCESIISNFTDKPEVKHTVEPRAYYTPSEDTIHMPAKASFASIEGYYATLFHEFIHSTGHERKLDRHTNEQTNYDFGSPEYSREELVAELGSAFLCAEAGIDNSVLDNNTAYLQSWLKALKQDKRLIIYASGKASKAADYILGRRE